MEDMVTGMHFWKNKKVLITGHTGFKGGWLSIWLQKLGADVTGFSLPADDLSLFHIGKVANSMTSILGDIRIMEQLHKAIKSCQPEIIFHMAAQAYVRASYVDPVDTFATNVMGTVNLLEVLRHNDSVRVIVNVTSDKCYENREWVWGYRESDPLGGYDPYSCSKGCAELVSSAYRRSFLQEKGIRLATVRAGNVIGGGDWGEDRLIPDLMQGLLNKTPVILRYPNAVRPWQFVCEPLRGYLMLAERMWKEGSEFSEAWNFGPSEDDTQPVAWIADYLCSQCGETATWQHYGQEQPHEAGYLKLDCSKAKNKLGWRPKLTLTTALDWTIEWYRAYQAKADIREMTEQQIARYENTRSDA